MNRKMMVLAISVVSAAAMALPAVASAGTWHLEPAQNGTWAGGQVTFKALGITSSCSKATGTSVFNVGSTTTGTINLTFHECGGGGCTETTTALPFHLVLLEAGPPRKAGILITTNEGHFLTPSCYLPFTIGGNGIIGELSTPACGAESTQTTVSFGLNAGGTAQQWTQITTTGTVYGLTGKIFGGTTPLTLTGTFSITTANKSKVNCT